MAKLLPKGDKKVKAAYQEWLKREQSMMNQVREATPIERLKLALEQTVIQYQIGLSLKDEVLEDLRPIGDGIISDRGRTPELIERFHRIVESIENDTIELAHPLAKA